MVKYCQGRCAWRSKPAHRLRGKQKPPQKEIKYKRVRPIVPGYAEKVRADLGYPKWCKQEHVYYFETRPENTVLLASALGEAWHVLILLARSPSCTVCQLCIACMETWGRMLTRAMPPQICMKLARHCLHYLRRC